jgi:hypothetical protein
MSLSVYLWPYSQKKFYSIGPWWRAKQLELIDQLMCSKQLTLELMFFTIENGPNFTTLL